MDDPTGLFSRHAPPDDWHAYRKYPYLLARLALYLLVIYLVYVALSYAKGVLSMLFVSLIAAYVLDPVVDWFEARGVNRSVAILILVLAAAGFGSLFFLWTVPTLAAELASVAGRVHGLLSRDPGELVAWAADSFHLAVDEDTMLEAREKAQELAPKIFETVGGFLQSLATKSMGVVGWLLNVVMIPVFVFYFLRDFDRMKGWVVEHLPVSRRDRIVARGRRVDAVVGQWLRGQVEVALILAVLYSIGLSIVGIKLAVPIGILGGLLNVIPYLGFASGLTLGVLMCLLEWTGGGQLAAVLGVFAGIHLLEVYFLTPRIVGHKVGLSPVTVLIVLLLGGELYGLLGFLLAVPTAGAIKTVLVEVIDWYKSSEHYLGPAGAGGSSQPPTPPEPATG